jgi:hypothetical protein
MRTAPAEPAEHGRLNIHPAVLRKIVEHAADGEPGTLRHERRLAGIAIGVGVTGLLLIIVGLAARRRQVRLEAPTADMTVTTPPRVLARLVGTRVRASDDVLSASVTASARRVAVTALAWHDAPPDLREAIVGRVKELLDELPLRRPPPWDRLHPGRAAGVRRFRLARVARIPGVDAAPD